LNRRPLRVLVVSSHPVQYSAPMFRRLAQHPQLDVQVAYCNMRGANSQLDPDIGIDVKWDVPLLEGYAWVSLSNRSSVTKSDSFFGLVNPGIWRLVSRGKFDASSYSRATYVQRSGLRLQLRNGIAFRSFSAPTPTNLRRATTKAGIYGLREDFGQDSSGSPTWYLLRRAARLH
jgi:hypothetical protein